jgi:hypothetical protein
MSDDGNFISLPDAPAVYKVGRRTLQRLNAEGKLAFYARAGSSRRWVRPADVEAALAFKEVPARRR